MLLLVCNQGNLHKIKKGIHNNINKTNVIKKIKYIFLWTRQIIFLSFISFVIEEKN